MKDALGIDSSNHAYDWTRLHATTMSENLPDLYVLTFAGNRRVAEAQASPALNRAAHEQDNS